MKVKCFLMDKCLKSDFTFQMAFSLPSTTLRKNMERSGVSSAVPRHLTTNDIMTVKCFPNMSWISVVGHACMTLTIPRTI